MERTMKVHSIISHLARTCRLSARSRRVLLLGLLGAMLNGPAPAAGSAVYRYDSLGRLFKVSYSNGVVITYSYDAAGNRTSHVTTGVVAAAVAK